MDGATAAKEMMASIRNMYKGHNAKSQVGDRPEWQNLSEKETDFTYKTSSLNFKGSQQMREQKEGLPIFKLRGLLEHAIMNNRVLVVIGETGSGKTT